MATRPMLFAARVGRSIMGVTVLALYFEAFALALPFVVLSLLLFDPVAAWLGPMIAVVLLGATLWLGWRAFDAVVKGDARRSGRLRLFASAWLLYNAAALVTAVLV